MKRLRDRAAIGTLPVWTGLFVWLDPDEDILLEAVDQHTNPRIGKVIRGIRSEAIWFYRSSLNVHAYMGKGEEVAETYVAEKRSALQPNLKEHLLTLELFFSHRMRRRVELAAEAFSEEERGHKDLHSSRHHHTGQNDYKIRGSTPVISADSASPIAFLAVTVIV